ncbi:MAG: Crp/Fnr family transcriptional regulator [Candidatus Eremiobacteraeota bacterium]|nr:Crp/Fnr family transcriptional regulator [Candidatus Eremiobacteraeota bacterium]
MNLQALPGVTNNFWLDALPVRSRDLLFEMSSPLQLRLRETVTEAATPTRSIYFPVSAVFSMVVTMSDGKTVEANMVGREGYVPVSTALLPFSKTAKTVVQVAGDALAINAGSFADAVRTDPNIAALRDRYLAAVFDVVLQSVGCNAVHSVRERCARWLLALADRTESHDVNVIHQVLAETLGASRPRVTEILATLQNDGLLELQRATLRILDLAGLRSAACECYGIIKTELQTFGTRKI